MQLAATVHLRPEAQLSNSDIARVEAVKTRIGRGLILQVWLTKAGAARLKVGGDPKLPSDIGVPIEPKEAQQLAASVSRTWPPRKSP